MFFNWGFEARKWQLAIRNLQHISFLQSFKAICTGTTMASFTPNRTGEYVGRILYIEDGKRIQGIALTIVCSMAQLQVTLYTGIIALWSMRGMLVHLFTVNNTYFLFGRLLVYLLIAGTVLLTLFYFRVGWFITRLHRWKSARRFIKYIEVVEKCNATILLRILSLSVCRYLVFIIQYYLVFRAFSVEINLGQCLQTISILFLLLAVVPSFTFLTDLGIRWKAGIEIVSLYSTNAIGIFAAAFTIWVINLIVPALIGSLLILGIRIFKSKEA